MQHSKTHKLIIPGFQISWQKTLLWSMMLLVPLLNLQQKPKHTEDIH